MNSKSIAIFILLALVMTAGWLLFSSKDFQGENTSAFLPAEKPAVSGSEESAVSQTATLIVDFGDENVKSLELPVLGESFVFDLLQRSGLQFEFKEYDIGVFIEAIEGVKNGADNKYWLYYVNEEMPMVSADKQPVMPGDKVEFKFEKSTF